MAEEEENLERKVEKDLFEPRKVKSLEDHGLTLDPNTNEVRDMTPEETEAYTRKKFGFPPEQKEKE